MFAYNFVLYFSEKDYNKIVYSDFDNMEDVEIHHGFQPHNRSLKRLHAFHNSERLNNKVNLPFKSIWFNNYLSNPKPFYSTKPLCFVFMFIWAHRIFIKEYILYLRKKYPNAKFVCYYTDIISSLSNRPEEIQHLFDLIITYDRNDARTYNLLYFPTSFSDYKVNDNSEIDCCDVLYLGKAKDRYSKIISTYNNLIKAGAKCKFFFVGVPKEAQLNGKGLFYLDHPMNYDTYLSHVKKCRIILEIEQTGAVGETLRNWEAINFNKGLLTDNPGIKESNFYDINYIGVVGADGDVDTEFVKSYKEYDNPLKEKIRPINLLEFIQQKLEQS